MAIYQVGFRDMEQEDAAAFGTYYVRARSEKEAKEKVLRKTRGTVAITYSAPFQPLVKRHLINAGGGDGFESYRYTSAYSKTEAIQKTLHQEIVKGTGWKDRGVKKAGYYVLKHTKMPAVLTENLFIDNPSNLKLLKQASVREKCARAHVAGMAKAFGWKKKQAGPKPPEPTGGLWVVQCGAFKEKKNAEEMKAKLEKAGFSAYVFRKS